MRRVLAAALVLAAACKSSPASRPLPARADLDAGPAAAGLADAGFSVGADAGRDAAALLEQARSLRAQVDRELLGGPDSLALAAADAQRCAEAAHAAAEANGADAGASPGVTAAAEDAGAPGTVTAAEDAGAPRNVTPAAVEGVYLQAVCTAAWLRTQGFTPLVERRVELFTAFSRVAQADPDLDGAGAERELGALFAELPASAGGDLQKARSHLEKAIARAEAEPRNHLVLARAVAVKAQDRGLFERELRKALQSGDAASRQRAQSLLDREDDLFGAAQAAQPTPGGPQR